MAQHYKLEDWAFMPYYKKLKKRIDWVLWYASGNKSQNQAIRLGKNLLIEPSSYIINKDKGVNQVLTYRTKLSDFLDYNNTNLKLSYLFIELHCKTYLKRSKLIEAYFVI